MVAVAIAPALAHSVSALDQSAPPVVPALIDGDGSALDLRDGPSKGATSIHGVLGITPTDRRTRRVDDFHEVIVEVAEFTNSAGAVAKIHRAEVGPGPLSSHTGGIEFG